MGMFTFWMNSMKKKNHTRKLNGMESSVANWCEQMAKIDNKLNQTLTFSKHKISLEQLWTSVLLIQLNDPYLESKKMTEKYFVLQTKYQLILKTFEWNFTIVAIQHVAHSTTQFIYVYIYRTY